MHTAELSELSCSQLRQAVRILREGFANTASIFAMTGGAHAEVESFVVGHERGALTALEGSEVLGWIGWLETHSHGWEIHSLAVDPRFQHRGIGRYLVTELENRASAAGILTLWLGANHEFGGPAEQATLDPIAFSRKLGFEVVGLLPDVNGLGKPDILMAKRLSACASRRCAPLQENSGGSTR